MTNENIELEAYRLIRIKSRDMLNPCTDEELGQYVRGIVDLQTRLYGELVEEQHNKSCINWSKIPYNTKILVSQNEKYWNIRYFSKYENGKIYAFDYGTGDTAWKFAKLADDE